MSTAAFVAPFLQVNLLPEEIVQITSVCVNIQPKSYKDVQWLHEPLYINDIHMEAVGFLEVGNPPYRYRHRCTMVDSFLLVYTRSNYSRSYLLRSAGTRLV